MKEKKSETASKTVKPKVNSKRTRKRSRKSSTTQRKDSISELNKRIRIDTDVSESPVPDINNNIQIESNRVASSSSEEFVDCPELKTYEEPMDIVQLLNSININQRGKNLVSD